MMSLKVVISHKSDRQRKHFFVSESLTIFLGISEKHYLNALRIEENVQSSAFLFLQLPLKQLSLKIRGNSG